MNHLAIMPVNDKYQIIEIDNKYIDVGHLPQGTVCLAVKEMPLIDNVPAVIDDLFIPRIEDLKSAFIENVIDFAESTRKKFTGNAGANKLSGFQINSDILNLIDSGVAFDDLDDYFKQKVMVEVESDDRYSTVDELLLVWRAKRGKLSVASAWAGALENNTITALKKAKTVDELNEIMSSAKSLADAKFAELMS